MRFLTSIVAILLTPQLYGEVTLHIHDNLSVESDRLFAIDIARCEGDADTCAELRSIYLGALPPVGEVLKLEKVQLKETINSDAVKLEGPDSIQVQRAEVTIAKDEFKAAVESRIREWIKPSADKLRLNSLRLNHLKDLRVPKCDYTLSIREEWSQSLLHQISRNRMLNIDIIDQKSRSIVATTKVGVSAQMEQNTLVARRDLRPNLPLVHEDLEYQWLPLIRAALTDSLEIKNVIEMSLVSPVKKGQMIRQSQLARPKSIKRGELVKLRMLSSSGMQLDGEAKALTSGSIGDEIKVLYAKTKKTIQAVVVDRGMVEVRL